MIILARALVLAPSEVDAGNPDNPIIAYHNIVSSVVADTEATGYPASNLLTDSTAELWRAGDTTEQYLTISVDEVDPINYLAVGRHNFGTAGIATTVEGQTEEGGDWEVLVEEILVGSNVPLFFQYEDISLFGLRLKLASGTAVGQAAILRAGRYLQMPPGPRPGFVPPPYGRVRNKDNGRSESGNYLGTIITGSHIECSATFEGIDEDWYRDNLDDFLDTGVEGPFFFAWAPTRRPLENGFMVMTNDPQPLEGEGHMISVTFEMAGIDA